MRQCKLVIQMVVLLLLAAGCRSRLISESKLTVEPNGKQHRSIDPISRERTVNIAATAASGQFSIFVFLEKDKSDAEKAIDANKTSPTILAQEPKTAKANLSATIPANERAIVLLKSSEKTEVNVRISN